MSYKSLAEIKTASDLWRSLDSLPLPERGRHEDSDLLYVLSRDASPNSRESSELGVYCDEYRTFDYYSDSTEGEIIGWCYPSEWHAYWKLVDSITKPFKSTIKDILDNRLETLRATLATLCRISEQLYLNTGRSTDKEETLNSIIEDVNTYLEGRQEDVFLLATLKDLEIAHAEAKTLPEVGECYRHRVRNKLFLVTKIELGNKGIHVILKEEKKFFSTNVTLEDFINNFII